MVLPLFNLWHKFLDTKLSHSMMDNLTKNQQQWEELRQRENYDEQLTDVSEASDRLSAAAAGADDLQPEPEPADGLPNRRGSLPAVMLETVDKMGRRHSVPLNLARATATQVPPGSSSALRRDSLGAAAALPPSTLLVQAENRRRFTLGQIPYLEEEEEGLSLSLGSSRSSGLQRSSDGGGGGSGSHKDDRPVSAENLIPEPSIATITNTAEASRLCNVIHGVTSPVLQQAARSLTRQQTFPPIQPYVRARYLSTGGGSDLVPCSSSSGGTSAVSTASSRTGSTSSEGGGGNGGGGGGGGGCVSSGNGTKRDNVLDADRVFKLARFSTEKENVDPASRTNAEIRRNSNHVNQVSIR